VLRDIEALRRSWFRAVAAQDSYGREQPSFDLTRQGFMLLVMGWTGERVPPPNKVRIVGSRHVVRLTFLKRPANLELSNPPAATAQKKASPGRG